MQNDITPRRLLRAIIRRNGTITDAAKELGCTRQHLGAVLAGTPAGCKLARRIEQYAKGMVSRIDFICEE